MAITPSMLIADIRNQVTETTAKFYSDNEIRAYLWQAEIAIAKKLQCTQTTHSSTSTTSGTREYAMPDDVLEISRVTWNSFPLTKIVLDDLDRLEGAAYAFTGITGNPVYYYENGANVGLSPIPNATQTLKFWYTVMPTVITDASTGFTIPAFCQYYLTDYCLWRMYEKDSDQQRATFHREKWNENLNEAFREWKSRQRVNKRVIVKDTSSPMNLLRIP